jgi:lipopolysaccharide/colanic/teichoic acid biosynthesis glycosyltransferase
VGKFLRAASLDELPQIINVFKGDMSLVGPRPTSFEASTYALWHTERLEVLPGITGLWQISGRSEVDFDERVRLDIEYIERRSLAYDVTILLKTAASVVRGRGAY